MPDTSVFKDALFYFSRDLSTYIQAELVLNCICYKNVQERGLLKPFSFLTIV